MARAGAVRDQGEFVDVVILTVIPAELEAARRVLGIDDGGRSKAPDGTVYFRGAVRSELVDRDYAVALSCIGGAGNPGAAAATASAIAMLQPRAVLLMGIAAGIRDKVRIGEVVLSDRVVAYEPAALIRSASGVTVQPRPEVDRAPHTMIQDVVSYRSEPSRLYRAFVRAGGVVPAARDGHEGEFRAHVASAITARQGTIASGEKLLRDPAKLLAVREMHGKTEVGEMEAAGVVDGCRRGAVPWLVIRGISDFGDELKDDRFHLFASCAAAAVLHDFLAHGLDLGTAASPHTQHGARAHLLSAARNPFVFGRAIDRDEDFVGRVDERRWLREAIDKRQPVQLLGERLMGKTSLLRWVERTVFLDRRSPLARRDPRRSRQAESRGGGSSRGPIGVHRRAAPYARSTRGPYPLQGAHRHHQAHRARPRSRPARCPACRRTAPHGQDVALQLPADVPRHRHPGHRLQFPAPEWRRAPRDSAPARPRRHCGASGRGTCTSRVSEMGRRPPLARTARSNCIDRKILVVIDEIERVEDGIHDGWCSTDFLDFLRAAGDALQRIRFLLLTAYPLHRLGPHWTDRLVSVTTRTISYLGEDDARELLAHPIPEFPDIYPEGGVEQIRMNVV